MADGGKSGNKIAYMNESELKEYKSKLSKNIKNSTKHQEALKKVHNSKERNLKISLKRKGQKLSEEAKLKLKTPKRLESARKNFKIASELNQRPVIQFSLDGEFIKEYSSIKSACISIGVKQLNCSIGKCCKGTYKTGHGYIWKYKNKEV